MNKNEFAFPQGKSIGALSLVEGGMTLRDYFAAKALEGMMSCQVDMTHDDYAKEAFLYADAMLVARGM